MTCFSCPYVLQKKSQFIVWAKVANFRTSIILARYDILKVQIMEKKIVTPELCTKNKKKLKRLVVYAFEFDTGCSCHASQLVCARRATPMQI